MYSYKLRSKVKIKIPNGFSFDFIEVQYIDGKLCCNQNELRNLFFYSDLDPLLMRNSAFVNELLKNLYFHHRENGGRVYDFLEDKYIAWKLSNRNESGKIFLC